ncbi:hypothetical protein P692DRAFT_20821253 [Suillus brevipes Sb2]|nr:hypothetical protein P692DRAFT_20821253 [Suillus brevipes Sb2]
MDYVEILSSDEEESSLANSHSIKGRNEPANHLLSTPTSVLFNDIHDEHWVFLRGLSMDNNYLDFVEATHDLVHDNVELSKSSKQMDIHESCKMLEASLNNLRKANISNSTLVVSVVLGLGMLFRECSCVIEYEEDEASSDTPAYLANSVFDSSVFSLLGHTIKEGGSAEVKQVEVLVEVQTLKKT